MNKEVVFNKKILLNSARNCLAYVVRLYNIREIYIPFYICPVIWQTLQREGVKIHFYHIDKNLTPICKFKTDDYILYPNYFGICNKNSTYLASQYKNLILDNAQAFFAPKAGLAAFYSPRKFLNVNDGGILYCDKELDEDFSYDEDRHYKIESFESFCHNEISLDNQPIKFMSERTACIIKNIDFTKEKILKRQIFNDIHTILHKFNNLKFELNDFDVPMIYPIISNQNAKIAKLLDMNNIYTIRYWTNFPESFFESYFQNQLLGIPLLEKSLNVLKVLD